MARRPPRRCRFYRERKFGGVGHDLARSLSYSVSLSPLSPSLSILLSLRWMSDTGCRWLPLGTEGQESERVSGGSPREGHRRFSHMRTHLLSPSHSIRLHIPPHSLARVVYHLQYFAILVAMEDESGCNKAELNNPDGIPYVIPSSPSARANCSCCKQRIGLGRMRYVL